MGECNTQHEPDAFAHAVFRFSRLTVLRCLTRRFSGLHFAADISPLPKCAQAFPVMTFASLMTLGTSVSLMTFSRQSSAGREGQNNKRAGLGLVSESRTQ